MFTTMLLALILSIYPTSVYADLVSLLSFKDNIIKTSREYGVNPQWMMAIIMQESGGNPNLYRYEPKYHYFLKPGYFANLNHISMMTEISSQRTSWGLGSICGGLAREQGYTGLLPNLLNPELNIRHIGIRMRYLQSLSPVKDEIFSMYNYGPAGLHKHLNPDYVQGVNAELFKIIHYKP